MADGESALLGEKERKKVVRQQFTPREYIFSGALLALKALFII